MSTGSQDFLQQCLLLDIETHERGGIYSIGAVFRDERFLIEPGQQIGSRLFNELEAFGSAATFLLGHNIISHDIPRLRERAPFLRLLRKPAIDTLYLSPLAFPENPYHRLVKDYRIVRDSMNDPMRDALLAGRVFAEQWDALSGQLAGNGEAPLLYRSFLIKDETLVGTAQALGAMGIPVLEGDDLHNAFSRQAERHACGTAVESIVGQLSDGRLAYPPLAYATAWLRVAGGNSVLPPWVRHRFPEVPAILHQLRDNPCGNPGCGYCPQHHNPKFYLKNFFGFDDFREKPATEEGGSLQEEIVLAGVRDTTLFATLPTGGGKSLCYLLPALMRYQRRNLLTIVISPLQALMKDQVDNFSRQTGTGIAAALSGMLTMPERSEVQEGIRLGDIGILYISPEQLRNRSFVNTVGQREIGAWVFDEAHCLSKWGHDFRPDYLYSIRFIREFAGREMTGIPPVQCFTATAKRDVKAEIVDIIQSELGLRVRQFAGGHERTNLHYEVWSVERHEKLRTILELLRERYRGIGSVVIYCARRKNTEELAGFLQLAGYSAEAFHAGLEPSLKKRIQDDFIAGLIPIVCATNAFGMGIDKEDVRLVIHADIPGSLENYLQEAGRAGRDRREAECILIFSEQDIEGQFQLSSASRLSQREIAQLLRGIRYAAKGEGSVVMTAGELLRLEVVDIDPDEHPDADARVRTAISWLERTGYLERNENDTRVFQVKPLVRDLTEAEEKMAQLNLSARQRERWSAILAAFMERRPNRSFSADELAGLSPFTSTTGDSPAESETQRVIRTLHDMAEQGMLSKETTLSAYIRYQVAGSSEKRLRLICDLEHDFLKTIEELAPEADTETSLEIDLRQVNQKLVDLGHEYSTPQSLKAILYGLSRDGKGLAGRKGSLALKARGNNRFNLLLHRPWESLGKTVKIRQQAAFVALQVILGTIAPSTRRNADLLVEFSLEQIVAGLKNDLVLLPMLKDPLAAAERALTFMHEQSVIDLQQGLAVFRQAMTLAINEENRRKQYSKDDFLPLNTHYRERNFQIHVMNEYARRSLEKLSAAMNLVASYFNDEKEDFVKRFFPGKEKFLERATSEQSYQRIVDDLKNGSQEKIVSAGTENNILVLAGPGSGKTRVVAHRVAYLLRVKRVNPKAILVLCFNRSAAMGLRKRLRDLLGSDMVGVDTMTFHGFALRLTGRSLVAACKQKDGGEADFSGAIREAIRLLSGENEVLGFGDAPPRDALLGRYSHILVDEYQDIDAEQYELVSLLAGRRLKESEGRLTIMAVGDDDQNIYRFRGANVGFIRRFQQDYASGAHYLVENYRSTANIIAAANALISHNADRMKTDRPIEINRARRRLPAGGNWQVLDRTGQGKVQLFEVLDQEEQALAVLEEIRRLQSLDAHFDLKNCAILAREWRELDPVRAVFEENRIPICASWRKSAFPSLTRIRENAVLLAELRARRTELMAAGSLLRFLPEDQGEDNIWQANLRTLILEWLEDTRNVPQPVARIEEYLYEALHDQHRLRKVGRGVFLSTVHSVKGLEFDHVFVLGGEWRQRIGAEMEEERRLYYVAMTRARETLQLFSLHNRPNPHTAVLSGDWLRKRVASRRGKSVRRRNYELLGMTDLDLGFAGSHAAVHPVHGVLAGSNAGDLVNVASRNSHIEIVGPSGCSVARLSKAAKEAWAHRIEEIGEARIVAMIRWDKSDTQEGYNRRCRSESWEIPLVEVVVGK